MRKYVVSPHHALYDSVQGERAIAADLEKLIGPGARGFVTQELVFEDELGAPPIYTPGQPVEPLAGEILPGAGWGMIGPQ